MRITIEFDEKEIGAPIIDAVAPPLNREQSKGMGHDGGAAQAATQKRIATSRLGARDAGGAPRSIKQGEKGPGVFRAKKAAD
jgi:hypothetical protein